MYGELGTYSCVCLNKLLGVDIISNLDELHTHGVGVMRTSFNLVSSLDEHLGELVGGIVSWLKVNNL